MKQERGYFLRFFVLNILLVIPLLFSSILGTVFLRYEAFREEKRNSEKLFAHTMASLNEIVLAYQEKAIVICNAPELQRNLFTTKGTSQTEAFAVLNNMMVADKRVSNMFIDFDQEYLYSMYGLVEKRVLFDNALGCKKESTNRGIAMTDAKQTGASFLHISDGNSVMLLGYTPNVSGSRKAYVSFFLRLNEISNLLRMIDHSQWYLLEAADGSGCAIGFDATGQAMIMNEDQAKCLADSADYYSLVDSIPEYGLSVSLYSQRFLLGIEDDIWNIQILNILLLVVATVYRYSCRGNQANGESMTFWSLETIF